MDLLSPKNSFYRYLIEDINDISVTNYKRRSTKREQNNKKSFFFEVTDAFATQETVINFLKIHINTDDIIAINHAHFNKYTELFNTENCLLVIANDNHFNNFTQMLKKPQNILFKPATLNELRAFNNYDINNQFTNCFWMFTPYNKDIVHSITSKDIYNHSSKYKKIHGLDIFNSNIPTNYELEPLYDESYQINWKLSTPTQNIKISVIIPSYNSVSFLSNTIYHLTKQSLLPENYEIIVVDDGSSDNSSLLLKQLLQALAEKINLKYIYWSKCHPTRKDQKFFRPGLARNIGSRYSCGELLFFLDSDMLVPKNFIETCILELKNNNIIQFQRLHINQNLSRNNPVYENINTSDTYIEEKNYWSELFNTNDWMSLPFHWKYTCTYALGISKNNFLKLGMFKKYYISYGFEDTDLGYEAALQGFNFKLIKIPLMHQTAYDLMQYRNSTSQRFKLLRVTAELFYLQHLDKKIYELLGNYLRFQKPLKSIIRDFLNY